MFHSGYEFKDIATYPFGVPGTFPLSSWSFGSRPERLAHGMGAGGAGAPPAFWLLRVLTLMGRVSLLWAVQSNLFPPAFVH